MTIKRTIARVCAVVAAIVLLAVLLYAGNVWMGMRAHARYDGTISGLTGLRAPVSVLRDDRGVPHLIARDEPDLFFAQGYVEGSDRLFQLDLLRRFIEGRLSEVLGTSALRSDETERAVPVRAIVEAQWRHLDAGSRADLIAFSAGVNAAMSREPLPVEFRILAYRPQPWQPQDSLAVAMATVLDLIDDWNTVADRDRAYRSGGAALLNARFPLTDPCYDAPVLLGLRGIGKGSACTRHATVLLRELEDTRPPVGSNEWAAGATRSRARRALLANDPHLSLSIPSVWYLIDLRAPGFHAAGATFPGAPGVVLGHNENVAWGATDGTVTSLSVFAPPARLDPRCWQTETFGVRFGRHVTKRYWRDPREFGVLTKRNRLVLVRWNFYTDPISPAQTFVDLDRARSMDQAISALSRFPGPTQNFVLIDTRGRAAYALAGSIPSDPVRSRWIHPAGDLQRTYPPFAFARLPKVAPSRDAVVWTSNNQMYGADYPLSLSPQYAPPYRAYRVAQMLRARPRYSVAYFARMQMDVLSLPELELARDLGIRSWNGEMTGGSTTATRIEQLRLQLTHGKTGRMPSLLDAASAARAQALLARYVAAAKPAQPWRIAGAVPIEHALSAMGIDFLNGPTLPGDGDSLTVHVQYSGYSQSFRAVWEAGDWDAGGITLPQGESGEPGSGHYADQTAAWLAGKLWPLPFSPSVVERTAVTRETLAP